MSAPGPSIQPWSAIDPDEVVPNGPPARHEKWRKANLQAYGMIFKAIRPVYREWIKGLNPPHCGRTAWATLQPHYQAPTPSYRLSSLSQPFAPIRTTLNNRAPPPTLDSMIIELLEFERREGLSPSNSSKPSLSLVATTSRPAKTYTSFNWLNSEDREDVCARCGKSGHEAPRCVFDMPKDVKDKVLGGSKVKRLPPSASSNTSKPSEVFYMEAPEDPVLPAFLMTASLEECEADLVYHPIPEDPVERMKYIDQMEWLNS